MTSGMRPHGSPQQLEERRFRAMALLRTGRKPAEVARAVGVEARSVRRWAAEVRQGGRNALRAKPASGRPAKLSVRQRDSLRTCLLKGARANGFPTEVWTCPRLVEFIERTFNVTYHVDHLPRLLHGLGFSCQKPTRRARERDEQAIGQWVARDWPRIKKKRNASMPRSTSSMKQG